jgi:transporter family protein
LLLGEPVTTAAAGAVLVLLLGVAVLAPGAGEGRTTTRAGYLWAAVTAVFNATNSLVYKSALSHGAQVLPLFAVALLVAFPVALLALAPLQRGFAAAVVARLRAALAGHELALALGAVGYSSSFVLALLAMRSEGAAWVLTLRNVSIAFAALFAWALLGERPSARATAGLMMVVTGAILLGLG